MRRRWIALAGVVPLWIAALPQYAGAAATVPDAPPASPQTASQKKHARTSTKNKKKKTTPKASVVPKRPAADIPAVTETAAVWRGCLEPNNVQNLASGLKMDEARLESALDEDGLLASDRSDCVPFVAAKGGEGGVASAVFQRAEPKAGESPFLAVRRTANEVTVTPAACDCPELFRRVLSVPARTDLQDADMPSIPSNVRWQLNILVPQMLSRLAAEKESSKEAAKESTGEAGPDAYSVRVTVERHAESEPEHLQSIEITDPLTGKRLDGVWWLERPGGPGVIIGMEGLSYERLLWLSPLKYVRKSRGVGAAVTTLRRRVPAPKDSGQKTVVRTVRVGEFHIGADLMAPKGTDVHAVGDATVAFAGRRGGYGNLIVLNHGRGYQTYYAHLSAIKHGVKAGASVSRGDVIGLVGSTGHSTAPHLHFETRKDTRFIDPFDDTRQLEFWLLTAEDQDQLAMQLLASTPDFASGDRIANRQEHTVTHVNDQPAN